MTDGEKRRIQKILYYLSFFFARHVEGSHLDLQVHEIDDFYCRCTIIPNQLTEKKNVSFQFFFGSVFFFVIQCFVLCLHFGVEAAESATKTANCGGSHKIKLLLIDTFSWRDGVSGRFE